MFGKRHREEQDASPGTRLKQDLVDIYSRGSISAQQCSIMLQHAGQAKVQSCQLVSSTGRARDLQRALLKSAAWPPLYIADVPVKSADGQDVVAPLALLLPHEVMLQLLSSSGSVVLGSTAGLDHISLAHLKESEEAKSHAPPVGQGSLTVEPGERTGCFGK